jgi:hypothetical protein
VRVVRAENRAYYQLISGDRVLQEASYTLDRQGAEQVLQQLAIDPAMLQAISGSTASVQPKLSAQQSSMHIRGERLETYLVSLQQGGQTMLDMHVSQLGGILGVQTFFGYRLEPNDIAP